MQFFGTQRWAIGVDHRDALLKMQIRILGRRFSRVNSSVTKQRPKGALDTVLKPRAAEVWSSAFTRQIAWFCQNRLKAELQTKNPIKMRPCPSTSIRLRRLIGGRSRLPEVGLEHVAHSRSNLPAFMVSPRSINFSVARRSVNSCWHRSAAADVTWRIFAGSSRSLAMTSGISSAVAAT